MNSDLEILGPVGIRKFNFEKICETSIGHTHNYDHVTFVQHGAILVKYRLTLDGEIQTSKRFETGEIVLIKANVYHEIKALEPNTIYSCVFTHRDFDSEDIVQTYNGNPSAYT